VPSVPIDSNMCYPIGDQCPLPTNRLALCPLTAWHSVPSCRSVLPTAHSQPGTACTLRRSLLPRVEHDTDLTIPPSRLAAAVVGARCADSAWPLWRPGMPWHSSRAFPSVERKGKYGGKRAVKAVRGVRGLRVAERRHYAACVAGERTQA
jgi:hypothetical protein